MDQRMVKWMKRKWTKLDLNGLEQTKMDQNGQKLTKMDKKD